jgi:hypothetical protein
MEKEKREQHGKGPAKVEHLRGRGSRQPAFEIEWPHMAKASSSPKVTSLLA